jgi:hypothetical protein
VNDPEAAWPDARDRLLGLVQGYLRYQITPEAFCDEFERLYNLHLDRGTISAEEESAFGRIFERVVWYSPIERERLAIPGYLGPEEIRDAVLAEAAALGLHVG